MTDTIRSTPFPEPEEVQNGDVFFHKNMAFIYHADINTWEAWRVNKWAEEEDE